MLYIHSACTTKGGTINYHLLRFFGQNRREPIWNFQGEIVKNSAK